MRRSVAPAGKRTRMLPGTRRTRAEPPALPTAGRTPTPTVPFGGKPVARLLHGASCAERGRFSELRRSSRLQITMVLPARNERSSRPDPGLVPDPPTTAVHLQRQAAIGRAAVLRRRQKGDETAASSSAVGWSAARAVVRRGEDRGIGNARGRIFSAWSELQDQRFGDGDHLCQL